MFPDKKIFRLLTALLLFPAFAFAAAPATQDNTEGYNLVLISLVSLMIVLLIVIAVLGNVLRQLGFVLSDKNRKDRNAASTAVKTILLIIAFSIPAFNSMAAEAPAVAAPVFISGIPEFDFYYLVGFIGFEIVVIFAMVLTIKMLLRGLSNKPELEKGAKAAPQKSWFWDKFNAAATLEKEKDILLDHDYDGIQELDNSLPPWWKYGFYLTIVVGFIYVYRYHVSHDGPSQQDEYVAEMQKGEEDKAAYLAKSANNVDETNVVAFTDAGELAAGKELFSKNCAACHLADGGGSVGPNLTDEYWLHGGGVKDVFKSIKYGWQDKGMKSWKDDFSPKQIQELASFVHSLKGTHPAAPKAQQGELYIEASSEGNKSDSSKAKMDTVRQASVANK